MKPYNSKLKANRFSSKGVACIVPDYKTGRAVHLLSQGEKYYWYLLRWRDDVVDIKEQYELDLELTEAICNQCGIRHPRDKKGVLRPFTSDLYAILKNGEGIVYSVKDCRSILNKDRNVEKLFVERVYWESKNVEYKLVFKEDVNLTVVNNIMDVTSVYKKEDINSVFDLIRYKISHKEIEVDLTKPINYNEFIIEGETYGK